MVADKKTRAQAADKSNWKGFVPGKLSRDERAQASVAYGELHEMFAAVGTLVGERYKITVAADYARDCYIASAFANGECAWKGYTLTARAATWVEALQFLLFRHYNVMEGDWTEYVSDVGDDIYG